MMMMIIIIIKIIIITIPITLIIMMINNNSYISILPIFPSGFQKTHISPEEDWNFPSKNY